MLRSPYDPSCPSVFMAIALYIIDKVTIINSEINLLSTFLFEPVSFVKLMLLSVIKLLVFISHCCHGNSGPSLTLTLNPFHDPFSTFNFTLFFFCK